MDVDFSFEVDLMLYFFSLFVFCQFRERLSCKMLLLLAARSKSDVNIIAKLFHKHTHVEMRWNEIAIHTTHPKRWYSRGTLPKWFFLAGETLFFFHPDCVVCKSKTTRTWQVHASVICCDSWSYVTQFSWEIVPSWKAPVVDPIFHGGHSSKMEPLEIAGRWA